MSMPTLPTYHRQRFLILLLHGAGGALKRTDLQQLVFLAQEDSAVDYYRFVPGDAGCYSFHLQSDLEVLENEGWLTHDDASVRLAHPPEDDLAAEHAGVAETFMEEHSGRAGRALRRAVYAVDSYYALRDDAADDLLKGTARVKLQKARKQCSLKSTILYTLGYEGREFEDFANQLLQKDIRLVCDVRNNPNSRKFGFSRKALDTFLPQLGIAYAHLPELGIEQEKRKDLETDAEYQRLFQAYEKTLPDRKEALDQVEALLKEHDRIALTCYEAEPERCHRHCISGYLEKERGVTVTHL